MYGIKIINELKINERSLAKAEGTNPNPLYTKQQISRPLISEKAPLKGAELKEFNLYDIQTEAGATYEFTMDNFKKLTGSIE